MTVKAIEAEDQRRNSALTPRWREDGRGHPLCSPVNRRAILAERIAHARLSRGRRMQVVDRLAGRPTV